MLYTQIQVRDNIRNRDGKRVFYLGKGDQLTSGARDFLTRERIQILPADQARPDRYRLLSGAVMEGKPEHMTHLYGDVLVEKTHPRILFRGKMDTLEAELILCQLEVPGFSKELGEILALARKVLSHEVLEKPLEAGALLGMGEETLRRCSHFPQEYCGQPHFMPEADHGMAIARLNRARSAAREAELAGARAFWEPEGTCRREDLLRALNRLSSALYLLMIRERASQQQRS